MVDYMFQSLGGTITAEEFRALVVLHELAHLTGALGDHGQAANYVIGWKFSSDVFTKCIRGDKTPTEPAPRRQDDEEPSAGSAGDGFQDSGDFPWPGDPAGDPGKSQDQQGFDTDLTIRGGDGSVVEGGNVGDPNLDEPNYDDPCDPFYDSNPNGPCGSGYGDPDPYPYPDEPDYGGEGGGGGGGGDDACGPWETEECFALYYVL